MKNYNHLLAILLSILIISACGDDITNPGPGDNNSSLDLQATIEASLIGYISDSDGAPIDGAEVSILDKSVQSDVYGFFSISGLIRENQGIIVVKKNGYFDQFKTLIPSKTNTNRTIIRLIKKDNVQTITASEGGQVGILGEHNVQFEPNSFIDEGGNVYSGTVNVYSHYIDPTDPELDLNMPGNLMAFDVNDNLNILQSFGMVKIELEGDNSQKLNIDKPATLTLDVPSALSSMAPNEIPLWFFNEETGFWKEEGKAELVDGKYVGEVNHFTFWNCDIPSDLFTLLKGQVVNGQNSPLLKVRITNISNGQAVADWTDREGYFDGYVPKNEKLLLEVVENCGVNVIHSEEIGPFEGNSADAGVIDISNSPNLVSIEGTLVSCEGSAIMKGKVIVEVSNSGFKEVVETAADGSFMVTISHCNNPDLRLTFLDYDNKVTSSPTEYSVTSNLDIGTVEVCGLPSSVIIEYSGGTKVIEGCTLTIEEKNGRTVYKFRAIDYFNEETEEPTIQSWSMEDENNDLSNPKWFSMGWSLSPPPQPVNDYADFFTTFQGFGAKPEVLQNATDPGDILSLRFEDVNFFIRRFFKDGTISDINENGTWTLSGVLQE